MNIVNNPICLLGQWCS